MNQFNMINDTVGLLLPESIFAMKNSFQFCIEVVMYF